MAGSIELAWHGKPIYLDPMAAWTIQSLIDAKMAVTAHCQNPTCHRHQEFDLELLKKRLGPYALAMADDLKPKLNVAGAAARRSASSTRRRQPSET